MTYKLIVVYGTTVSVTNKRKKQKVFYLYKISSNNTKYVKLVK